MFENLFVSSLPFLNLIVRAVLVYAFVLLMIRISGKREIGSMGAIEFVTMLLISNAVQNSMNGGDNSVTGGLILAATLIAMSFILEALSYRYRWFRKAVEGNPILLIHKGKILKKNMKLERLHEADLRILLRKQGIHNYAEISSAILESDGTLSVTKINDLANDSQKEKPAEEIFENFEI
jgi:uncharacterized membrane protein YcaP (DUF421 family)